jgi:hypothetical protein
MSITSFLKFTCGQVFRNKERQIMLDLLSFNRNKIAGKNIFGCKISFSVYGKVNRL